ncbi:MULTISPECIES: aminotransferase class I/II-fold pyridoxal phosphate-dependent enzyme [Caballeronia]|nr:aminotransferase class I/II-fold pyridoxal phosphate-dependent enzyme [Caballeronia sp. GaOx3]
MPDPTPDQMEIKLNRFLAPRVSGLEASASVAAANQLLTAVPGKFLQTSMHDGEPDIGPPDHVVRATIGALQRGKTKYDHLNGLIQLREAICDKLFTDHSLDASPDELLVSNGSSQSIYQFIQCFVSPGDQVLVPNPAWPSYVQFVRLAGGEPVGYSMIDGFSVAEIEAAITPSTRLLIINSPHNPTGSVIAKDDLTRLGELAELHDFLVLCDDAYEVFVNSPSDRASLASAAPCAKDRIVTARSFSKTYGMTGYRIGYLHGSRDIVDRCAAMQTHLSDNVCTFAQYGALAALELGAAEEETRRSIFLARLATAYSLIEGTLPCLRPRGAFYLFPSIESALARMSLSESEFVSLLARDTGVTVQPGRHFGMEGFIRISVAATDVEETRRGVGKILDFIGR